MLELKIKYSISFDYEFFRKLHKYSDSKILIFIE